MKDPLRDNVKNVVMYAAKGRINVRMISGDNLDTAVAISKNAGIVTKEEVESEVTVEMEETEAKV